MANPHFDDLRNRFDAFAARIGERARPRGRPRHRPGSNPLSDDYWENVQDLFTRGVSTREFRDLFAYDAQDAFRYFTREVDLDGVWPRPWYQSYPLATWKVFLATAFRLSPARRIMFALAVPLLVLGWVRYLMASLAGGQWEVPTIFTFALVSATLLFALLMIELRDKLALKGDLEIARQIQFGLLPFEPFHRDGTSIYAAMRPANTVGGDYFDIIELGEGRVAIAMGDVAGKGIPAALLMALLQGSLRTLLSAGFRGADLMRTLNAHLFANIPSNRLITLFYCESTRPRAPCATSTAGTTRRSSCVPAASSGSPPRAWPWASSPAARSRSGRPRSLPASACSSSRTASPRPSTPRSGSTARSGSRPSSWAMPALGPPQLIEGLREDVLAFCGAVRPRDDMTMMVVAS